MKLSISNIGWEAEYNEQVYGLMKTYGFSGVEIAPTIWVPKKPYEADGVEKAKNIAAKLKEDYGFVVPSMQSILFGRQEKIFEDEEGRNALFDYMKQALNYAAAIGCKNLVFGCPKNRSIPDALLCNDAAVDAIERGFFKELGKYAASVGTVLAMEANPPIYNTNYMNGTERALNLVERMDSKGFLLNLDVGTMVNNEESVKLLDGRVALINHVHISEPGLKVIKVRPLHRELKAVLTDGGYDRFISIEVGKNNLGDKPLESIEKMMEYVAKIFA